MTGTGFLDARRLERVALLITADGNLVNVKSCFVYKRTDAKQWRHVVGNGHSSRYLSMRLAQ